MCVLGRVMFENENFSKGSITKYFVYKVHLFDKDFERGNFIGLMVV